MTTATPSTNLPADSKNPSFFAGKNYEVYYYEKDYAFIRSENGSTEAVTKDGWKDYFKFKQETEKL